MQFDEANPILSYCHYCPVQVLDRASCLFGVIYPITEYSFGCCSFVWTIEYDINWWEARICWVNVNGVPDIHLINCRQGHGLDLKRCQRNACVDRHLYRCTGYAGVAVELLAGTVIGKKGSRRGISCGEGNRQISMDRLSRFIGSSTFESRIQKNNV